MIRRIMLGVCLIGAAFAGLDCNQIFGLHETELDRPNQFFAGCFKGQVAEPAGQGEITIILVADPAATVSLEGCMQSTNPAFGAAHAGFVLGNSEQERTRALVTVMPQGRPAFALTVERQPPGFVDNAVTVSLVNETQFPFKSAPTLLRCDTTPTCADLGIPVPFVSSGSGKRGALVAMASWSAP